MKIYLFDENFVLKDQIGTPDLHQYEDNATMVFFSVEGINETNYTDYVATFSATLAGATAPTTDIVTEFVTLELSGIEHKGFRYMVSRKFTQIAGSLTANFVLSKNGVIKVSQSVFLNVMASSGSVNWNGSITQAQWYQLLAYSVGLRNPNLGEIDLSTANILDDYRTEEQLGAYLFIDSHDGYPCLLFVTKDRDDIFYQTIMYVADGGLLSEERYYDELSGWSEWENFDGAESLSYTSESGGKLYQLSNSYTVESALTTLDKLMPNPVILAQYFNITMTGVDTKTWYKFTDDGNGNLTVTNLDNSNLSDADYTTFVGKYGMVGKVIPSTTKDGNQITFVLADGTIYNLYKNNGVATMALVTKYALASAVSDLGNSFTTKSLLVKDGSITILRAQNNNIVINGGGNYIGINPSLIEFHDKGNTYAFPYPSGTTQTADEVKIATVGMINDLLDLSDGRYGADFDMSLDSSYVLTIALKDHDGNTLRTRTVDFPAEMAMVDASYDNDTKDLTFTLQNGNTVTVPLDDIISGLATETYVDTAISTATNDMATKTWTDTQLGSYYTKNQTNNNFAPLKGKAPQLISGASDNFAPYNPETTSKQSTPFITEGTATNNNTGKVDTGTLAYVKAKIGNSVVVNQKAKPINSDNWNSYSNTFTTTSFSDGTATVSVTDTSSSMSYQYGLETSVPTSMAGHKYLIYVNASSDDFDSLFTDAFGGSDLITFGGCYLIWNNVSAPVSSFIIKPYLSGHDLAVGDSFSVSDVKIIDLTQWFGSNDLIPTDLLNHPEHFLRYYRGSLEYNEGTLTDGFLNGIVSFGRNLCKDSTTTIYVVPCATYHYFAKDESTATTITFYGTSTSDVKGMASVSHDSTFTVPSDCTMIKSSNGEGCISPYYANEGGYDKYYPYNVVGTITTGAETLRSAGNVKDEKKSDGTITRKVVSVDLSTLSWTAGSNGEYFADISGIKLSGSAICSTYQVVGSYPTMTVTNKSLWVHDVVNRIIIKDTDISGTSEIVGTLNYELATPTTETGTSFPENLPIDDFGQLHCPTASTSGVPLGFEIDYPADYRGFVDSLLIRVRGDGNNVVTLENEGESLSAGDPTSMAAVLTEIRRLHEQEINAAGGTLRQCLCVKENLNFDNTDFIDFGDETWVYSGNGLFYTTISSMQPNSTKALCTKYAYSSDIWSEIPDKKFGLARDGGTNYLMVKDTVYTDAITFKAAMKGVLLAYEKASE